MSGCCCQEMVIFLQQQNLTSRFPKLFSAIKHQYLTRIGKMTKPKLDLEDILDCIENEDLAWAIAYLKKREDSWQDWLSMPSE